MAYEMSGDSTIESIKERLRDEGYTSETIGEVLREVNRSFLAEDAGAVIRETKAKASQLQSLLEGIYEALIPEPVLDLRIACDDVFAVGGSSDAFDLYIAKSAGRRLTLSYVSRETHPVTGEESIRLGRVGQSSKPDVKNKHIVLARIIIDGAEAGNGGHFDFRIGINRDVLESDSARAEPNERFHDCLTFLDFASDKYDSQAYSTLIAGLGKLSDRIGTYLAKKREFLRDVDFS